MSKSNQFSGCITLISIILMQCHTILSINQLKIVKRMDIATCLAKFDVKNDMIIKTAESRKLGARYLDSADSLSKVECLHLCCETENCDVFVYEEKGQGECFLFHCGPAQDFRCKFTKHLNYTSAVLSMEKKVAPPPPPPLPPKKLNNNPMLSQSEIELKSLKGKSLEHKITAIDATPVTTITSIKAITTPLKNATSHCSRFQFQCHSGDCIAVYNACDGIPQCDDGSDEGPECRTIARTPEPTPNKSSVEGVGRVQLTSTNSNSNNNIGRNREDPLTAPQWPNLNQSPDVQQYTHDKTLYNQNSGLRTADNIQQISQLPVDLSQSTFPVNSKDTYHVWNNGADPNLIGNWPQQMPEFPGKSLQFQSKQSVFPQYQSELVQKTNEASDQSQSKGQQQYGWPILGPNLPNVPIQPNPPINHLNENNEEILPEKDAIGVIKDVPVSDRKKDGKNLLNKIEPKSTEDSDYNNEEDGEITTEPPKKKKKHRKVNKVGKQTDDQISTKDVSTQQLDSIHSALNVEFMDHDGEADRPGGAVVSLALGILITIGLVMVVSCRTTTVRKRVRRGKGYAHDADFLVNGMYL